MWTTGPSKGSTTISIREWSGIETIDKSTRRFYFWVEKKNLGMWNTVGQNKKNEREDRHGRGGRRVYGHGRLPKKHNPFFSVVRHSDLDQNSCIILPLAGRMRNRIRQ